jgi:hypothetical protein
VSEEEDGRGGVVKMMTGCGSDLMDVRSCSEISLSGGGVEGAGAGTVLVLWRHCSGIDFAIVFVGDCSNCARDSARSIGRRIVCCT